MQPKLITTKIMTIEDIIKVLKNDIEYAMIKDCSKKNEYIESNFHPVIIRKIVNSTDLVNYYLVRSPKYVFVIYGESIEVNKTKDYYFHGLQNFYDFINK